MQYGGPFVVVHTCKPSLTSKFKASLGYTDPVSKKPKPKTKQTKSNPMKTNSGILVD
jgi:hypothetical protein